VERERDERKSVATLFAGGRKEESEGEVDVVQLHLLRHVDRFLDRVEITPALLPDPRVRELLPDRHDNRGESVNDGRTDDQLDGFDEGERRRPAGRAGVRENGGRRRGVDDGVAAHGVDGRLLGDVVNNLVVLARRGGVARGDGGLDNVSKTGKSELDVQSVHDITDAGNVDVGVRTRRYGERITRKRLEGEVRELFKRTAEGRVGVGARSWKFESIIGSSGRGKIDCSTTSRGHGRIVFFSLIYTQEKKTSN